MNKKVGFWILIVIITLSSLLLSMFLTPLIYCSSFYVHEGGHILFGKADSWIKGNQSNFEISATVNCPFIPFWNIPQQTRIIKGASSVNFILGGPLLVLLVVISVSYFLCNLTGRKIYWVLFPIFLFHEFFGNFLCGTDNLNTIPYAICNNSFVGNLSVCSIVMIAFFILFVISQKFVQIFKSKNWLKK